VTSSSSLADAYAGLLQARTQLRRASTRLRRLERGERDGDVERARLALAVAATRFGQADAVLCSRWHAVSQALPPQPQRTDADAIACGPIEQVEALVDAFLEMRAVEDLDELWPTCRVDARRVVEAGLRGQLNPVRL
jgi:hypothetical protein